MFQVASENNKDEYTETVTELIRKCIGDVVPIVTITTYPIQKPWVDGSIHAKLKVRTIAFNHGKVTGNMAEYKQCSYSLRKAIKQAKRQFRDKVVLQFNSSDTRQSWTIKGRAATWWTPTSCFMLNTFFAHFEDNTVPPTWPATKDCGLSFSVADVSKTFKCVNPRKAASPDGIPSLVLRACAEQLAGVFMDIFSLS
jgi:hypothetical protein